MPLGDGDIGEKLPLLDLSRAKHRLRDLLLVTQSQPNQPSCQELSGPALCDRLVNQSSSNKGQR